MPARNAAKYIQETIVSIQNQTLSDWELIVVDDHSSDETIKIVRKITGSDKRIKIYKNEKPGITHALQLAFKFAQGEFISRMDADDLMPKNKLELLYNIARQNHKIVATGKVQYFSDQEISPGYLEYENWLNEIADKNLFQEFIFRECVIASPNWMVHRSCFDNDIKFDELQYPEDYDLVFKFLKKGYEIKASNEITHFWREHPERISRNSENYNQEAFFKLKAKYFADSAKKNNREIILIGNGVKRKLTSHFLTENNCQFKELKFQDAEQIKGELKNKSADHFIALTNWPKDLESRKDIEFLLGEVGFYFGKNLWLF